MLKVGLLGAGRIGRVHARSIQANPRSSLIAVSDVVESAAQELADAYGAEAQTSDQIISRQDVDAVLIATSTDTHADLIEAAAAAGKAVYCEKPIDLDLARAERCFRATSTASRPVMIGFNRRFDPHFNRLKDLFEGGEIGKAELLSLTSFDPAPPPVAYVKVSGGLFRDMAIHDFDMACWLMGGAPQSVSAIGSCVVEPEIGSAGDVDTAATTLRFANGSIAVIKNSRRAAYGYDQRIELLGESGLLAAENVLEHTVRKSTADGVSSAKPRYFFLERYQESYARAWEAFLGAALDGAPSPVSVRDGVMALAVAEAASQSAQSGRSVRFADVAEGV